jgi:uncharacterized protein YdaL
MLARLRSAALLLAAVAALAAGCAPPAVRPGAPPGPAAAARAARTLVLYDETGPHGWLGELYAVAAGHLASRFGGWQAAPARGYRAGDLARFDAAIYVGSTHDEPLPDAFLDDVLAGATPVLWVHANVWQLQRRSPAFAVSYGFKPWKYDASPITEVRYRGVALTRARENAGGVMTYAAVDRARAEVLAEAVREDGTTVPWALRSRNLLYVGDNPFAYATETDRYLAFADLLFDLLAPAAPERHRALARIEDISPTSDPARLRALVDALAGAGVPFALAVIPVWVQPGGTGRPTATVTLSEAPALVAALRDATARGGTLVLHGYTHQWRTDPNPYSGVTADDFEFWSARLGPGEKVVLGGPVPEDSEAWAADRIQRALREFDRAGLPRPRVFEFPHYVGSAAASRAIARLVPAAYHRGLYFSGALEGKADPARQIGQIFPYPGHDVYGFDVVPENCGPYRPEPFGPEPRRVVEDFVRCAKANRAVRDGFASFFYHPQFGPEPLLRIVRAIQDEGYTFVSAEAALAKGGPPAPPR